MSRHVMFVCTGFVALALIYASNIKAQSLIDSPKLKREILQQMVSDGEAEQSCLDEQGQNADVIDIYYPLNLGGGKRAYSVEGKFPCAYKSLLYLKSGTGYKLIFSAEKGAHMQLSVAKTITNGLFDVVVLFFSTQSFEDRLENHYKFDGERYKLVKCLSCSGVRGRRGKVIAKCVPARCD